MALKCGIVGLPNVGKSTLFNALSSTKAVAANYPFCTIEPNVAIVPVPDVRLDKLAGLVNPKEIVPAVVQIVDIAGLVRGASKNEGLGNKFLANIRECNAILHVLRCFEDSNVIHVENSVNPLRDKEIIDLELQLKDLETLDKTIDKAKKNAKGGSKDALKEIEILEKMQTHIQTGQSARTLSLTDEEVEALKECYLLTDKPILYICNVDENSLMTGENQWVAQVRELAKTEGAGVAVINANVEAQIQEMENPDDRVEFLTAMNIKEPGLNVLARAAYQLLGLQTYFTAGPKEVHAWTITEGTKAPLAAAVIHSSFEKHFIRAEVIKFEDYISYGSETAVKEAGKLAVEGKDYVVKDGDVIYFRVSQ